MYRRYPWILSSILSHKHANYKNSRLGLLQKLATLSVYYVTLNKKFINENGKLRLVDDK